MSQPERIVHALPYTPKIAPQMDNDEPGLRLVAGYARVSTNDEEQQTSYEKQIEWYTNYIQSHKGWKFVGMYADEGVTGTSMKHRDGFNRMIQDALDGKIQLIITKSVSRFARNTVDSLTTVRQLKEKGVEVYFEKENIFTLDAKGELLITIMSSLAQEESRSISENVTWGKRKSFADGKVSLPYKHFLGYKKGADGKPEIVESEAKIVRQMYALFLDGMTPSGIAKWLMDEGISSPSGKTLWRSSTVKSILTNEKYRGDALLQKTYTVDFLTKEKKINDGEIQQYYVEGSHPAIIPSEVFELVQVELADRKSDSRRLSNLNCFSNKLVCAQCGSYYGRKTWHSTSKYRRYIWQCGHKFKGGDKCGTPHLYEDEVKAAFLIMMGRIVQNRDAILDALESALAIIADTTETDRKLAKAVQKQEEIAQLMRGEVDHNARVIQDQDEYNNRYAELTARFNAASAEVERLKGLAAKSQGRSRKLTAFMETLRTRDSLVAEFDEGLWSAVVQDVMVHENGDMTFRLRDGSEQKVEKDEVTGQ